MTVLFDQFGVSRQLIRDGDRMIFSYTQDCDAIIERNKQMQNPGVHGRPKNLIGGKHLATIPVSVIYEALKKYGIQQGTFMRMNKKEQFAFYRRIYSDPDYKYLRVS